MLVNIKRHTFTEHSAIGVLSIDGIPLCSTLEDKVRTKDEHKVWGETAIPVGTYGVIVDRSNRFSRMAGHDVLLPLLLNVPGFEGVRIHPGNRPQDTEGCILLGVYSKRQPDWVSQSRDTFAKVFPLIQAAHKAGQSIKLTIS